MIDMHLVASSGLWILGLSILLAAFSYHAWEAGEAGRPLREQLRLPPFRLWQAIGFTLFCVGFGVAENVRWWQRALWLILATAAARGGWAGRRRRI